MQEFGASGGARAGGSPGFVLLYAEAHPALPAAWPFTKTTLTVGREPPSDVALPVSAVSRLHAEVRWDGTGWVIRDAQSRNGVLVNGCRIAECHLEPLDEVRIGDAILKFVDKQAEEYQKYRLDGSMAPGSARAAQNPSSVVGGYRMDSIVADMERIAASELNVLLLGPSGTGKEVVANELHRLSGRPGPLCAINCAAIPANLLESELFGYRRGAFSGADRDKPGLIRAAHRGTLLLDEIGDMPLDAQAKLLRVIQSKEVLPLGATQPEHVDLRIACATHRDLTRLRHENRFREDLFARLNEYQVRLPALHERKEDIHSLFRSFLGRHGRPDLKPSVPFMVALLHHDWPHNVRELEAATKRAAALATQPVLEVDLLPDAVREAVQDYGRSSGPASTLDPIAAADASPGAPSEEQLRALLQRHAGNVAAVGRELGKARMQIHRWMKRHGIEVDEYRS